MLLLFTNCGTVFNYLSQVFLGRAFTPEDFGVYNSLNSLAVILAAPLLVIPLVVARFSITYSLRDMGMVNTFLRRCLKFTAALSLTLLLVGLAAVPAVQGLLHLDEAWPIVIMLAQLFLGLYYPIFMGMLQGLQRFLGYGLCSVATPMFRFITICILALALGWGVSGALLAGAFGSLAAIFIGVAYLRDIFRLDEPPLPDGTIRELFRYTVPVLMCTVLVLALGNLDIVLVRHFCTAEESGYYATAAILGRIAYLLPGVFILILFPDVARRAEQGDAGREPLFTALGLSLLVGGGFTFLSWLRPQFMIRTLFGGGYDESAPLLGVIAAAMTLLSLAQIIFTYGLARKSYTFLWPLGFGVAALLGGAFIFHANALQVAWLLFFCIAAIFLGSLAWLFAALHSIAKVHEPSV